MVVAMAAPHVNTVFPATPGKFDFSSIGTLLGIPPGSEIGLGGLAEVAGTPGAPVNIAALFGKSCRPQKTCKITMRPRGTTRLRLCNPPRDRRCPRRSFALETNIWKWWGSGSVLPSDHPHKNGRP